MYFCAWCLTSYTESTDDSHDHVRSCPSNPHPGAAFGDYDYWSRIHVPCKRKKRVEDECERMRMQMSESIRAVCEARDGVA